MNSEEVKRLFRILIGVSVCLLAASSFYRSWGVTIGLSAGLVVGVVNFYLIVRIVSQLIGTEVVKKARLILIFLAKVVLLVVVIGLIILKGHVRPLPFLIGISNTVIAAIVFGAWSFWRR